MPERQIHMRTLISLEVKRPSTTLIRDSLLICFFSLLIANILLFSAEIRPPVPCMYEFHPWLSSNVRPSSLADFSLGV